MTALAFGWITALCWGVSTLTAAAPTRLAGPWVTLFWTSLIASGLSLVIAIPSGLPDIDATTAGYIAFSGVGFAGAATLLLFAINSGRLSLVTPIVGCDGAIAALITVALGASVTMSVAVGLLAIVLGIVVVSASQPEGGEGGEGPFAPQKLHPVGLSVLLAVGSALLFGATFYAMGKAADVNVFWLVALNRGAGVVVALAVAEAGGHSLRPRAPARPWLVACGVFDVLGFVAFVAAARDDIAIASVAASQYAAVTVIGAAWVFRERISAWQLLGIASLLVGAAILAASEV